MHSHGFKGGEHGIEDAADYLCGEVSPRSYLNAGPLCSIVQELVNLFTKGSRFAQAV